MRNPIAPILIALIASGCASAPQAPIGVPALTAMPASNAVISFMNGGFELWMQQPDKCPDAWGCGQHTAAEPYKIVQDTSTFTQGKASLSIERREPGDWAKVAQSFSAVGVKGKKIRFSAMVKRDNVTGAGGLLLISKLGGFLGGDSVISPYKAGTHNWTYEAITTDIAEEVQSVNMGFALEGSGKIWFDDAKFEIIGEK